MKLLSLVVGHDASACVIKDGNILFFMEEEKLTYLKKDHFPLNLLKEVKKYVDDEIDVYIITYIDYPDREVESMFAIFKEFLLKKNNIKAKKTLIELDHHLMHASCAFYGSGFTEALVFVSDGGGRVEGDWENQEFESVYVASYPCNFNLLEKMYRTSFSGKWDDNNPIYSMGGAFQMVCEMLDFKWYDSGKIMGLSAYGNDNKNIDNFFIKKDNKWIANKYYYKIWGELEQKIDSGLDLKKIKKQLESFQYKADLAYKVQKQSKERSLDRINDITKKNKIKNFVMTGGYALNCVNNYEYIKAFPNINFYFDPLANDAGTSLGAAKYYWHKLTNDEMIRPLTSLYLGHEH